MDKLTRNLTIGIVVLILLVGGVLYRMPVGDPGDVSLSLGGGGGDYYYKYVDSITATSTALKTSLPGTFGGVTITEDAAVAITFYDATSTTAYSITNGTKIAVFEAAQAERTYLFDVAFSKGLIMNCTSATGFGGSWTVFWN